MKQSLWWAWINLSIKSWFDFFNKFSTAAELNLENENKTAHQTFPMVLIWFLLVLFVTWRLPLTSADYIWLLLTSVDKMLTSVNYMLTTVDYSWRQLTTCWQHVDYMLTTCWLQLTTFDFRLLQMTLLDFRWLYLTSDDSWLQMTLDFRWLYLTSDDFTWLQMTLFDFRWLYLTSDDFTWLQMTLLDFRWL